MSVSRGRRSRESRMSPSVRRKGSAQIDAGQKKFVRKLAHALLEVIDGKGHLGGDIDEMGDISEESNSDSEDEKTKDGKVTEGREKSLQSRLVQEVKEKDQREVREESKAVSRFKKLQENHGQLTYQIQSSLNALGGGGRTAKALERMHEGVSRITELFYINDEKTDAFRAELCMEILSSCKEAASEVLEAFKELGVYNRYFFDTVERIQKQLETVAVIIDVEYGIHRDCRVDKYMDSVFEPLIVDFETFLSGLTNIAEKEIAVIRSSQDFTSQRYLNLTTVATFLSSVTATTLQITANDSGSPLTPITNTLWFVSLVFSTASAVYSLLVMTWRQSSVCQPNLSLPRTLNIWFRNGPMYTLIAAVMTFSIGLCLLAFHIAEEQGGIVSAAIPTAFAGAHAYVIFVFSAWFLLEQWKVRHRDNWVKLRDTYLIPLASIPGKTARTAEQFGIRLKYQFKEKTISRLKTLTTSVKGLNIRRRLFGRRTVVPTEDLDEKVAIDMESGQDVPLPVTTPSVDLGETTPTPLTPHDNQEISPQSASEPADESHETPATAEPESALAIPETQVVPENAENEMADEQTDEEEQVKYKPFEEVLQFSPDGRFLAAAYSETVTIYNVDKGFTVFSSLKAPDEGQIKQIAWNPDAFGFGNVTPSEFGGELFVRSLGAISTWNVRSSQPDANMVGHLSEAIASAHWSYIEDDSVIGLVCSIETMIKVLDDKCKETRSIDLSKLRKINRIIDADFFGPKYIFCLADLPNESLDSLLVVNAKDTSIESARGMYAGHISMIVSSGAEKILFHGSESGVEVADMQISRRADGFNVTIEDDYRLWMRTAGDHELAKPEGAVTFHGNKHRLIVGYSAGEVVVLYRRGPDDYSFSALHIFTTPTTEAMPQNPISFAVNKATKAEPYMFAFGNERGSVTIWSVQSNKALSKSDSASTFEIHDRRKAHSEEPVVTTGRFLSLPPPGDS